MDERVSLCVQLDHDGLVGWGEAVPSTLYGQTLESTESALAAAQSLLGDDPFAIDTVVGRLLADLGEQRAAIAAIDNALHDWVARRLGVPVWRLLGLDRPCRQTTFTIGVADAEETRRKIDEALADGFDALKVKVGTDHDDQTLAVIRDRFAGPLLLDANQAWTPAEAQDRIRAFAAYRPAVIEQPLRKQDWPAMAELRGLSGAAIIADESCETPADVVRLRDAVDGVNIKFTKCGGIREALRMIALARQFDLKIMLGCFVSSSLAIAPALAIASLVDWVDLDGHLLLADDPYVGIQRAGGAIALSESPGFGLEYPDGA